MVQSNGAGLCSNSNQRGALMMNNKESTSLLNMEINNNPKTEKKTYTVFEIQRILGISPSAAYALIRENVFHSVKVGRSIRISKSSFDAWLNGD